MKTTHGNRSGTHAAQRFFTALFIIALLVSFAPEAKAGFIGYYDLNNFTLTNTCTAQGADPCPPPDGFATTFNNGVSAVLFGGNNGSGLSGVTDLVIAAQAAGTVQFDYSYSAFDFPGADYAGYLKGNVFTQLANTTGQASPAGQPVSFTVTAGQLFGFRVGTVDNLGEPGILTISNFDVVTGPVSTVPEPGSAAMLLAGCAALVVRPLYAARRRKVSL